MTLTISIKEYYIGDEQRLFYKNIVWLPSDLVGLWPLFGRLVKMATGGFYGRPSKCRR